MISNDTAKTLAASHALQRRQRADTTRSSVQSPPRDSHPAMRCGARNYTASADVTAKSDEMARNCGISWPVCAAAEQLGGDGRIVEFRRCGWSRRAPGGRAWRHRACSMATIWAGSGVSSAVAFRYRRAASTSWPSCFSIDQLFAENAHSVRAQMAKTNYRRL